MLGKVRDYINRPENKKILSFIIVLVILATLPIVVIVSQQQQEIRQRASELVPPPSPPFPLLTPTPALSGYQRVFVTSTNYTGNLGGLAGADAKCQERANAAKLGGTWKAWLSSSYTSAVSRIIHSTSPYKLVNGVLIASHFDDLKDGGILHPINVTEFGRTLDRLDIDVWTNTTQFGGIKETLEIKTCRSWRSTTIYGKPVDGWVAQRGYLDATSLKECGTESRLYCFEQIPNPSPVISVTLSPTPTPTPSGFCTACSADINKDGKVNSSDLTLVRRCLNKSANYATGAYTCSNRDINKDGIIDIVDMNCVARNIGQVCK